MVSGFLSNPPAIAPGPAHHSVPPRNNQIEAGEALLLLVRDLGVPFGMERSFKFLDRTLLTRRFLVGIDKGAVGEGADGSIAAICSRLGMPEELLRRFREQLPRVNFVLFGCEESDRTAVYKVYLEYYDQFPERVRDGQKDFSPFLLHLGFKWDVRNPARHAVTRYTWQPMMSLTGIRRMMSEMLNGAASPIGREAATAIVDRADATGRMTRRDWHFLEVADRTNPRRSFDINLYRADLRLRDVEELLVRIARRFSVPDATFRTLFELASNGTLGHVAAGFDRSGKEFFTVYYEMNDAPAPSSRRGTQ